MRVSEVGSLIRLGLFRPHLNFTSIVGKPDTPLKSLFCVQNCVRRRERHSHTGQSWRVETDSRFEEGSKFSYYHAGSGAVWNLTKFSLVRELRCEQVATQTPNEEKPAKTEEKT
jgi:hypothetical protein